MMRLVTVETYNSATDADLARAILELEGLTVVLDNENTVRADWFLANVVGGVRLMVPEDQVDLANAVLDKQADHEGAIAMRNAAGGDKLFCLACGAEMAETAEQCPVCDWSYADEGSA